MHEGQTKKRNLLCDVLIVVVGVALLMLTQAFGLAVGKPLTKGAASVWMGLYIIYLGVLFLLSYFFQRKSYVLSVLMWICENFSSPRSRHMALFYSALSFAMGLLALFVGFGIL
jgi:hypothetical protein